MNRKIEKNTETGYRLRENIRNINEMEKNTNMKLIKILNKS